MKVSDGGKRSEPVRESFQPVTRRLWVDSNDPRLIGDVSVELSPSGIRWWWTHDPDKEVVELSGAQLIGLGIMGALDDFEYDMAKAKMQLANAAKRIDALQRLTKQKRLVLEP